jgi:hypothetical protein
VSYSQKKNKKRVTPQKRRKIKQQFHCNFTRYSHFVNCEKLSMKNIVKKN